MRVVLNEADFRDLVASRVVTQRTPGQVVEIALATDIGWERMVDALVDAAAERGVGVDHLIRLATRGRSLPPERDDG